MTLEEARTYAASRGIEFPTVDSELEVLLVLGFDFIESFARRYQGERKVPGQESVWPRAGVVVDGYYYPTDSIPNAIKYAQIRAAEVAGEQDLMPAPSAAVIKEKIDVLEFEYAEPSPTGVVLEIPKVMTLIEPLFRTGGSWRVRVVKG